MSDAYGMFLEVRVSNFARLRSALDRISDEGYHRGLMKKVIEMELERMCKYASKITHIYTGLLARSHRWEYNSHTMKGRIFIDQRAVRRQGFTTVAWPKVYGPYEHGRGGSHAFYERTYREAGPEIMNEGLKIYTRELQWISQA